MTSLPPDLPDEFERDDIFAAEAAIALVALKATWFFGGAATAFFVVAIVHLIGG